MPLLFRFPHIAHMALLMVLSWILIFLINDTGAFKFCPCPMPHRLNVRPEISILLLFLISIPYGLQSLLEPNSLDVMVCRGSRWWVCIVKFLNRCGKTNFHRYRRCWWLGATVLRLPIKLVRIPSFDTLPRLNQSTR